MAVTNQFVERPFQLFIHRFQRIFDVHVESQVSLTIDIVHHTHSQRMSHKGKVTLGQSTLPPTTTGPESSFFSRLCVFLTPVAGQMCSLPRRQRATRLGRPAQFHSERASRIPERNVSMPRLHLRPWTCIHGRGATGWRAHGTASVPNVAGCAVGFECSIGFECCISSNFLIANLAR